ncbi:MAG: hypothetical protein KAQ67_07575 [Gammaproteobacteria bacterium]|nr:hypothetical protein [Gammaproteobacteria bacterium]
MTNKWRESTTFKFVLIAWALVSIVFIYSQFGDAPINIREYAETVGLILTPWLAREWRANHYDKN